jgi:hypothetical protein
MGLWVYGLKRGEGEGFGAWVGEEWVDFVLVRRA